MTSRSFKPCTGSDLGERVRDILTALEADVEINNLEEEQAVIIEEIGEVLEKRQKVKLSALRDIQKKNILEKTAKIDKVLSKFKTHSITKTNELFYAGAVVVTNRLGVKTDKVAGRKEPMWGRWLHNEQIGLQKAECFRIIRGSFIGL